MRQVTGLRHFRKRSVKMMVALVDLLLLNFSNTVAFWLRFHAWPPAYNWQAYLRILPWESASLLIVFYVYGLYHYANKTSTEMKSAVVTAVILNSFLTLALTYLIVNIGYPRSVFLISSVVQIPLYGVWHLLHRSYMLRSAPSVAVLVVGPESEWGDLTVRAGQFLPSITIRTATPETPLTDALMDGIGAVVIGRVAKDEREPYLLAAMARSLPCLWTPDSYDVLVAGAEMTSLGDAPMFSLAAFKVRHGSAVFKRAADVVIALLGLVAGLPLYLAIGLAITAAFFIP